MPVPPPRDLQGLLTDLQQQVTLLTRRPSVSGGGGGGGGWTPVPATTTQAGILELATAAETQAGADNERAITPATLATLLATASRAGLIEIATPEEVALGDDSSKAVVPTTLKAMLDALPLASETTPGRIEIATPAEVAAGTDGTRAVTPATLKTIADGKAPISHTHTSSQITDFATAVPAAMPASTTSVQGKVALATTAETQGGTSATKAVTPAGLTARTATETRTGLVELATLAEAAAGTDAVRAVTPAGMKPLLDGKAATVHTHTASQVTDFETAVRGIPASTSLPGVTQLAGLADLRAGTTEARVTSVAGAREMIREFAPVTGRGGYAQRIADFDAVYETGFYVAYSDVLNGPDTPQILYGTVSRLGSINEQHSEGESLATVQEFTEFNMSQNTLGRTFRRVDDGTGSWQQPWVEYAATESAKGPVRFATYFEAQTHSIDNVALTPKHLGEMPADFYMPGLVMLATGYDVQDGLLANKAVTPATLIQRTATEERTGLVELATPAEAAAGVDAERAVTPAGVKAYVDAHPSGGGGWSPVDATTSTKGIVELATPAETAALTDATRSVTPAGLGSLYASEFSRGLVQFASWTDTVQGISSDRAVAPAELSQVIPVGTIIMWPLTNSPYGWSDCNGGLMLKTRYPDLYDILGTTFNQAGDPNTHFRKPNFWGRFPVGMDPNDPQLRPVGVTGGAKTHTLTREQLPDQRGRRFAWGDFGNVNIANAVAQSGQSTGNRLFTNQNDPAWDEEVVTGGQPHNNMPPFLGISFMIRVGRDMG